MPAAPFYHGTSQQSASTKSGDAYRWRGDDPSTTGIDLINCDGVAREEIHGGDGCLTLPENQ